MEQNAILERRLYLVDRLGYWEKELTELQEKCQHLEVGKDRRSKSEMTLEEQMKNWVCKSCGKRF